MSNSKSKKKASSTIQDNKLLVWLATIVSVGILLLLGQLVVSDFESFQSCTTSGGDSMLSSCGKQSVTATDALLVVLFILSAFLVVRLGSLAIQTIRRKND